MGMKVLYERCAGCDIHKKTVTVHAIVPEGGETRTYGTTTTELLTLIFYAVFTLVRKSC